MLDKSYSQFNQENKFVAHELSENLFLLNDIYAFSLLAKLSEPATSQPLINIYIRELFKIILFNAISRFFPQTEKEFTTRMIEFTDKAKFTAQVVDPSTKVLICDLARAGMIPSQVFFDNLNLYFDPKNVILDHIMASRDISVEAKSVDTVLAGLKIVPEFSNGFILIPDPMGASGSSIKKIIDLYKEMHTDVQIIVMHLIITPEYVKRITESHPDVKILALRYDRGLSKDKVLNSKIGEFFAEEKSLTETKYIVPGAGGLGEIINNNYV